MLQRLLPTHRDFSLAIHISRGVHAVLLSAKQQKENPPLSKGSLLKCSCETKSVRNDIPIPLALSVDVIIHQMSSRIKLIVCEGTAK